VTKVAKMNPERPPETAAIQQCFSEKAHISLPEEMVFFWPGLIP